MKNGIKLDEDQLELLEEARAVHRSRPMDDTVQAHAYHRAEVAFTLGRMVRMVDRLMQGRGLADERPAQREALAAIDRHDALMARQVRDLLDVPTVADPVKVKKVLAGLAMLSVEWPSDLDGSVTTLVRALVDLLEQAVQS